MWNIFYQLASPKSFYAWAGKCIPWCWALCILFFGYGLIGGLWLAPPDYQQGDAYRIIFIHVPCAALSLSIFVIMAITASIFLIWRIKLADVIAKASAPVGVCYTFLASVTGSFWGKPMWGTWWIWDARLTSELILLFLYLGVIALRSAIPDANKAARASGILTIVGVVDIPIIHYSVYWWNTLHQKATLLKWSKPTLDPSMLYPLLAMMLAFLFYYMALVLMRSRAELLARESRTEWAKTILNQEPL